MYSSNFTGGIYSGPGPYNWTFQITSGVGNVAPGAPDAANRKRISKSMLAPNSPNPGTASVSGRFRVVTPYQTAYSPVVTASFTVNPTGGEPV